MINFGKIKAEGGATPTAFLKHFDVHNTSIPSQRAIVYTAIQSGSKTTIDLRHDYGIMAPAARIAELRKHFQIDTTYVYAFTPDGCKHRVALYTLIPGVKS